MKKIIYSLILCLSVIGLYSCDEDSHDNSKVTYFIELKLKGNSTLLWAKGTAYQEPGYTAILDGQDVSSEVTVKGSVDANVPGEYKLVYSAVNEDGFAKSLTRTVFVYDTTPTVMESGYYTVSKNSYRDYGGTVAYGKDFSMVIYQVEPGIFYTSDFLGGWYDQRAGYGSDYAMTGKFKLNPDNTIEVIESYIEGWGDSLNALKDAGYDPVTKTITWGADYTDYPFIFHVIATKSN